jgi:pSer/pThr/pTyr-binding forkhead associated (FHA) protein
MIEDLNSANGTYLNGERVNAGTLKEGSVIQFGTSRFLFRIQNPKEAVALGHKLVVAENGTAPLDELSSAA